MSAARAEGVAWTWAASVLSCAALLSSCGAGRSPGPAVPNDTPEAEVEVRLDDPESPPLSLRFRYPSPGILGSGGVHLWARPRNDEVRVSGIVDAPAEEARWGRCEEGAFFVVDGERIELETRFIGTAMEAGFYDAVRVDVGIHHLREMIRARSVEGWVCGDSIRVTDAQRRALARFVALFDRMAEPRQTRDADGFREVGPTIERMPNEDADPGPYPA